MDNTPTTRAGERDQALAKVTEVVLDGLRQGFFEITVLGEVIKRGKRRVTLMAGKSFQYVIPPEEVDPPR